MPRSVVALAGVDHLGRYICEAFLASPDFDVVILTRDKTKPKWYSSLPPPTTIHQTDYSTLSLLPILNATSAVALISFINDNTPLFTDIHASILSACAPSKTCHRLIPSEWIGDVAAYPLIPAFYARSREPFRQMLRAQEKVEWTLVCNGWIMDYFLPSKKFHMVPIPDEFPVDADTWSAKVRGTGEERQSWTCARDIGEAVVRLCKTEKRWDPVTYIAGGWGSFNGAIKTLEEHYGRSMPITRKPVSDILDFIRASQTTINDGGSISAELELALVEEMMVQEYLVVPTDKTLRHRQQFFDDMKWTDLKGLLVWADGVEAA